MAPEEVAASVRAVIEAVRERGDDAVLELTERWDRVRLTKENLRVPLEVLRAPPEPGPLADAFRRAVARIERFHREVRPRTTLFEDDEGVVLGLRWTPVGSVGLYVPGGKASYPSTLAMTVVPARVAGVRRIAIVSPPGPDGEVSPAVLLAARILGVDEVYRMGGAQAIAALALGTATVPRVDKIFGPGNAYVAEAKQQLFGEVGIDLVAGPSEIVVWADEGAEPNWVAADLMAQAEHDVDTRVTLLASSSSVLAAVKASLEREVDRQPRAETIRESIRRSGTFRVVSSPSEAAALIDEIAPEHLSLQVRDPWAVLPLLRNAGAIFLGSESPVAVGDYYAGPNHVLPTGRTARFASCLSVEDFMKRSNVCRLPRDFVRRHGEDVEVLAESERLPAHAFSVRIRREGAKLARPRSGVRSVTPYVLVEEEAGVKLNQNESPLDVPLEIKDEIARRLRDLAWNRYAQRLPDELARTIARDAGVSPEGVILGTGSNLVLQWIFEGWGGPGRSVLFPAPSFSLYPLWASVTETRPREVPLAGGFTYDADAFARAIEADSPALTILCLPNNPTGSELDTASVRELARLAGERGGLLVIDEAYREFSEAEFDRTGLVRAFENVVLVRTCSKAFAVAGMRLGYLLAHPSVGAELRKIVPPFHIGLFHAVLGQVLFERRELFAMQVRELLARRDRLIKDVAAFPGVDVVPTHANFFLFRVADPERVFSELAREGVLVRRPGGDPTLRQYLRVNTGTSEENERFLGALGKVLDRAKGVRK